MFKNFKPITLILMSLFFYKQQALSQSNIQQDLENVLNDWYTSIGTGHINHFSDLLTDDFQLLAFGKRFDKKQIIEMSKDYADITYSLNNVRADSGGDIASISFDIEMHCNYQGKPIVGKAMETYLFKKIGDKWKVNTKVIVMMED